MESRVAELEQALQDSESRLVQAGMMGKKLLDRCNELERENAALKNDLNGWIAREAAAEAARTSQEGQSVVTAQEREKDREELAELQRKNAALAAQIAAAGESNERLMRDLQTKEEELARANATFKTLSATSAELDETKKANETLRAQLAAAKESERATQVGAVTSARALEQEKNALQKELEALRAQLASAVKEDQKRGAAKASADQLAKELEEVKAQNSELLANKHSMEEAITSLVRQQQELRKENEEQMALLSQTRDTIVALKRDREESSNLISFGDNANNNNNNINGSSADASSSAALPSLLDELQTNMDNRLKAQEARPQRPKDAPEGAPENCEEYFLIAQTAVKIGLAIKYPHKSDEVFRVRGIDLYYKCLNSHVPFHQWHLWISRTLHAMLKGDVKPAALVENSKKQREKDEDGGAPGPGGGPAAGGSGGGSGSGTAGTAKEKVKGWLGSLFN